MGNVSWKHEMHLCIYSLTCQETYLVSCAKSDEKINTVVRSVCKVTAGDQITSVVRQFNDYNKDKKEIVALLTGFWVSWTKV